MSQQKLEEVLSLLRREGYETLVQRRDVTAYERHFFVERFGASPRSERSPDVRVGGANSSSTASR